MMLQVALFVFLPATAVASLQPPPPEGVWVRQGYELTVAAKCEFGPRFMAFNDAGHLYVSYPSGGDIYRLSDSDADGYYETLTPFIRGYPKVHGLQWFDGFLYFTQPGAIHRARDVNGDGKADQFQTVVGRSQLPDATRGHWWRSILIHDGRIYSSVGDPGNITDVDGNDSQEDDEREKIWSFALDGSDKKLFATGLRNTEKLVIRPGSNPPEIWGMDHGSDWFGKPLGDDNNHQPITDLNPPDEMNFYVEGGFYGHPFITGNRVPRIEFQNRPDIIDLAARTMPPQWCTPAHWAPNAMCFYTADQFPADVRGDAFVAFHGSWNRSTRAGYQVVRVLFEDGRPYGQLPYVKFLSDDGQVLGRPVDVVVAPDGTLLISDDAGKTIYRLRYVGQ